MKRKLTEREIETLEYVCCHFIAISNIISFTIFLLSLPSVLTPRDTGPFTRDIGIIAFIWFLISFICFAFLTSRDYGCLEFLRKRNDKIDEEEKAQLQAKAQAKADKETAEAQIWVNV